MARITLAPLVASLSGRIDGLTIRMTRNGPVMQKAQDTPPRLDDASLAVKDRFGLGVRAWSVMPRTLQDIFSAAHTKASHGSPGPWITAWSKYALTESWNYSYASDPDHILTITNATFTDTYVYFYVSGGYKTGYYKAWVLIFHPQLGLDSRNWWASSYYLSGARVRLLKAGIPSGSSVIILPKKTSGEDYVGVGDAYPFPH